MLRLQRKKGIDVLPLTIRDALEHIANVHVKDSLFGCGGNEITRSSVSKLKSRILVLEQKCESATRSYDQLRL